MQEPSDPPSTFWLVHDEGGIVAEGAEWTSGYIALHWPGKPQMTSTWESLDDLLLAHGHEGSVEWIDGPRADRRREGCGV